MGGGGEEEGEQEEKCSSVGCKLTFTNKDLEQGEITC